MDKNAEDKAKDTFAAIGVAVLLVVLLSPFLILRGWVMTVLWKWFVMPLFPVEPLGIIQALGLATALGLLTGTHRIEILRKSDLATHAVIRRHFTHSVCFLAMGWVLAFFL